VGIIATVIAAMAGIALVIAITFPFSALYVVFYNYQFLIWLWSGAVFAAPVTLMLLPGTAILGKNHPIVLYFLLPFVGLTGGIVAMKIWSVIRDNTLGFVGYAKGIFPMGIPSFDGPGGEIFVWTGAVAGLIAGCIFSAAVREMGK
jgi:hypothetical protein